MEINKISSLEEVAIKRKERLKELKRKHEVNNQNKSSDENSQTVLPKPKFRSYKPEDKGLSENLLPKTVAGDVKSEVKNLLDLSKSEMIVEQLDIATLAPRQPDWDLKRDVAKKLEKLERRTQRAMAELIRERLKEKQHLNGVDTENQTT